MQRKFDVNFKLSVVQMYLKHDEELHVIAERMGIHPSVILDWVKLYQYHGEAGLKTRSSHAKYETAFKEKVKAEIRKKALFHGGWQFPFLLKFSQKESICLKFKILTQQI